MPESYLAERLGVEGIAGGGGVLKGVYDVIFLRAEMCIFYLGFNFGVRHDSATAASGGAEAGSTSNHSRRRSVEAVSCHAVGYKANLIYSDVRQQCHSGAAPMTFESLE